MWVQVRVRLLFWVTAKYPSSSFEIFGLFFSSSFFFYKCFFRLIFVLILVNIFLSLFLLNFFEVKCVVDRYQWHRPFQMATTVYKRESCVDGIWEPGSYVFERFDVITVCTHYHYHWCKDDHRLSCCRKSVMQKILPNFKIFIGVIFSWVMDE